ncbi:MAG: 2'-5' RNA ligase family protein, partial [Chloroflexota bacterium]|nr:2'-5' RNA ligase family protein [Chloroflexota bacterium]
MAEERWRLFIAAPLPAAAAQQLWHALSGMRERHVAARWMVPEQYHATLVFLGSRAADEAASLAPIIERVAAGWPSFAAGLGGSGGRDGGLRGGVAWLKVRPGRGELARLSLELDRALGSGTYGGSAPRPHVTVAR